MRPPEWIEAGRVTADAYRELVDGSEGDWHGYLETLADVPGRAGRATVLVAVEAGRVLGSITLELTGPAPGGAPLPEGEAHLRMLGVDPRHRRRGIGRMLLNAAIEEARRAGRSRVTLHTTERMAAAQRLYETMGFRRLADADVNGMCLRSYALPLVGPPDR